MTAVSCPLCESTYITAKDYGKKAGGTIGTLAGAAAGLVKKYYLSNFCKEKNDISRVAK